MILNQRTLTFLKVFNTINPGILIHPGNVLKTISTGMTVFAKVVLDQEFPKEFAVHDLAKLVSILSLFNEPNIEFQEDHLLITSGKQEIKYTYCDPKILVTPKEGLNGISSLKSRDVEFHLSLDELKAGLQAANILSAKVIKFTGREGQIFMECLDIGNPTSDRFTQQVGETDKNFQVVFRIENMKIIPREYDVVFSSLGFAAFKAEDIEYLVAAESQSSHFGD